MMTIPQNQTLMTQMSGNFGVQHTQQQQPNPNIKRGPPEAGSGSHNNANNQQQTGGGASAYRQSIPS